jgi:hypothetical protein
LTAVTSTARSKAIFLMETNLRPVAGEIPEEPEDNCREQAVTLRTPAPGILSAIEIFHQCLPFRDHVSLVVSTHIVDPRDYEQ